MNALLSIFLLIQDSVIIDVIVVLIVAGILWVILNLILTAFSVPPYPTSKTRNLAYAAFLLLFLVFCLYRYLGVHLP